MPRRTPQQPKQRESAALHNSQSGDAPPHSPTAKPATPRRTPKGDRFPREDALMNQPSKRPRPTWLMLGLSVALGLPLPAKGAKGGPGGKPLPADAAVLELLLPAGPRVSVDGVDRGAER